MSTEESERLQAWYRDQHGAGDLSRAPFVTFLLDNRPDVLKQHRFLVEAKHRRQEYGAITTFLLFMHLYTVIADADAIHYEIVAARKAGATKAEVLETISFAYLHGATTALNAVERRSAELLREWTDPGRATESSPWPEGWAPDPNAFSAGLDRATPGLVSEEVTRLASWYGAFGSELPGYVRLLAKHRPEVLKEHRLLQEVAVGVALPKQIVPLFLLHLAVIKGDHDGIRFAAAQAQAFGVTQGQLLDTICWAMSYSGELGLRRVGDLLLEIVERWPGACSR